MPIYNNLTPNHRKTFLSTVDPTTQGEDGDLWFVMPGVLNPKDIPNLALWLDASTITGLVDGEAVSQWSDLSGNNSHALQADVAKRPLYKTGILNTKPVVRFDGIDDLLTISNQTYGNNLSLFIVLQNANIAKESYIYSGGHNAAQSFMFYVDSTLKYTYANTVATILAANYTAIVPTGNFEMLGIVRNDNNVKMLINDDNEQDLAHAQQITSTTHDHHIGYALPRDKAGSFFAGDIAEILIFNRAVSDVEKLRVRNYILNKYNL